MIQVELEERVERRDYRLPAVFSCYKCENDNNPLFDYVTLVVDGGIFHRCTEGHINKVHRRCTKCRTNYPLDVDICIPCERRIENVIIQEKIIFGIDEAINEVKYSIRKKDITKEKGQEMIKEWEEKKTEAKHILDLLNKEDFNAAGEITRPNDRQET